MVVIPLLLPLVQQVTGRKTCPDFVLLMLTLSLKVSSVRLFIPADLRPLDNRMVRRYLRLLLRLMLLPFFLLLLLLYSCSYYSYSQAVLKSIAEVKKRFPTGVPLLDPVKDMKIGDKGFQQVSYCEPPKLVVNFQMQVIHKIGTFEKRLCSHPLHRFVRRSSKD